MIKTTPRITALIPSLTLSLLVGMASAAPRPPMPNPDFTKGEAIPEDAIHDWNLGATGARGWIYFEQLVTSEARQIAITQVEKNSPIDGILAKGDVILGFGGKPFSYDPRTEMGKALTAAESDARKGNLTLTRWRDGTTEEIIVKLPILGDYSATAPYDCPKSMRILELGCEALAKRVATPGYEPNAIIRSLNALALLASGNPDYLPVVEKEAQWAASYSAKGMQTWYYAYAIMLLAEYHMATGDDSVVPGLRRLAMEASTGQSIVGTWGHKFAGPDGRLTGYGMMNAPGVPLAIALVLAKQAGIDDPEVATAIERSARFLRFYTGKGAIPYGDHQPWMETHEDNGKCGMTAVLFDLLEEPEGAEFFSRMSVASHGPERDVGHSGTYTNLAWAMPGVAVSGPHATGAWMNEFGSWFFDLTRRWDGTFTHPGPPGRKLDTYPRWDATGAYLLAYAMPLKKIVLTGKRPSTAPQIDAATAQSLILDGRGWSNKDRHSGYDQLSSDQLLVFLKSWSPIVRERAAMAFARLGNAPLPAIMVLLESSRLEARIGACQALALLKESAAPAVAALRKTLQADDLWLRIKAAEALAAIGPPAMEAVPEMLELLTQVDTANDPRGMQQRYISSTLFGGKGLLRQSLDGVDRKLLYRVVRIGLKNEDGSARGNFGSVYRNLTIDEIKPLLPAIYQAVVEPAPSGIMFADQIRVEGLRVMATHHIKEGIEACLNYTLGQNLWGSEKRTTTLMEILTRYGASAKPAIPELRKIAETFDNGEEGHPRALSRQKAETVREAIRTIEASQEKPTLIRIQ